MLSDKEAFTSTLRERNRAARIIFSNDDSFEEISGSCYVITKLKIKQSIESFICLLVR